MKRYAQLVLIFLILSGIIILVIFINSKREAPFSPAIERNEKMFPEKQQKIPSTSPINISAKEEKQEFSRICKIEGRVLDKTTNKPIKAALVGLNVLAPTLVLSPEKMNKYPYMRKNFSTITDENGNFSFAILSLDWKLIFRVAHDDYSLNQLEDTLQEGQINKLVTIKLCDCAGEIFGIVRDWKGAVIDEVEISAYRVHVEGEKLFEEHEKEPSDLVVFTDNQGFYSLKLPAGTYSIYAKKEGYEPYWFPSLRGKPIYLFPKSRVQHDITLNLPPVGSVIFRLIDPEGKSIIKQVSSDDSFSEIEEFDVTLWDENQTPLIPPFFSVSITEGNAPGEYKFTSVPTDRKLYLEIKSPKGIYRTKKIGPFIAPIHLGDIQLEYHPNRCGKIKIKIENGVKGQEINICDFLIEMNPPQSEDFIAHSPPGRKRKTLKEEEVILEGILPGKYVIVVKQGERVGSATDVIVYPGEIAEVNIILKKGTSVKGRVISGSGGDFIVGVGKRILYAPSKLIPSREYNIFIDIVNTDNDGNFLFESIPPGSWELMIYPRYSERLRLKEDKPKTTINFVIKNESFIDLGTIIY